MCACLPPALWPLVLIGLLLAALGITGLLNTIATAIVTFIGGVAAVAVIVKIGSVVIGNWLERRSDRRWNAHMAAVMAARHQIPGRRHVDVTVVKAEQVAIEAPRPALPPSVQMYATPQKELAQGVTK